ncbi:MAG: Phosphopentomutase [Clostridiales bacterium 38_11]|nr:MAG: Phosphopentomutase [Clostridiales bacterium 38_11]
MINRVILIILDSVGIGAMPDAHLYGDEGSNTILNIYRNIENFKLENLERMGLTHIEGLAEIKRNTISPIASYGRLEEISPGKDTTTGHWEISGVVLKHPFPTYPNGFPDEILEALKKETGRGIIGNKAASGTAIIEALGEEHVRTGKIITYTSADSVFQIAAHENVVPLDELYEICKKARKILTGKHAVGRVIARPFVGIPGSFKRTENRKDFSLDPTGKTMLDYISESGQEVVAIGKIEDIFVGRGITKTLHTKNNESGIEATLSEINRDSKGLIFTNLVDFDMLYGHRNNIVGYGNALQEFDKKLREILEALKPEDLLMISADHGCDPSTVSTDHSREYVPLLVYHKDMQPKNLGNIKGFNVIAKTILDFLDIDNNIDNVSLKNSLDIG